MRNRAAAIIIALHCLCLARLALLYRLPLGVAGNALAVVIVVALASIPFQSLAPITTA